MEANWKLGAESTYFQKAEVDIQTFEEKVYR